MDLTPFAQLSDGARLWIYAFERPLGAGEKRIVEDRLAAFMKDWHSHRNDVSGAFAIFEDRFVILAGASSDGISGCSIDSSVANFKYFRDKHGLDGLNRNLVFYRNGSGSVESADRSDFADKVERGEVGPETVVFDTTTPALGDLRAGRFEIPMRDSWHARAFLKTQSGN